MKKLANFLLLAVVLLAFSAMPVSAEATKTPIDGTCTVIMYSPNGGDPDFWYKYINDGTILHFRNSTILFYCDYSDDRLDGYSVSTDNWNWNDYDFNSPSPFVVREFGKINSSDENGVFTDLWEGSYTGYFDDYMNQTLKVTLVGKGENKGLLAKMTLVNLEVEGELLDTGH